jgi:hypothetical protein
MCADNLFFRDERKKIILEQQERQTEAGADEDSKSSRKDRTGVGFANLANIVSKRWWNTSPAHKEELEKRAKLEKERYTKEMAVWELMKVREEKDVIDLEDKKVIDLEDDDDAATSRRDDLQMAMPANQGFAWEGGSMLYPNAFFLQQVTPAAFNQSFALNQVSSMARNFVSTIPTMNHASFSGMLCGPDESFLNSTQLPFGVDKNPQRGYPWATPQGSLLFHHNIKPIHSFQFEGRRNSMPDSFQSGTVYVDSVRQQGNRRASLVSSVGQTDPDITHNIRPIEEIPIEEIKRFFNINPETNKVESNSCWG